MPTDKQLNEEPTPPDQESDSTTQESMDSPSVPRLVNSAFNPDPGFNRQPHDQAQSTSKSNKPDQATARRNEARNAKRRRQE